MIDLAQALYDRASEIFITRLKRGLLSLTNGLAIENRSAPLRRFFNLYSFYPNGMALAEMNKTEPITLELL